MDDADYWQRYRLHRAHYKDKPAAERKKQMQVHRSGLCGIVASFILETMCPEIDGQRYISLSHWGMHPIDLTPGITGDAGSII